jgi:hypothetical protein
MATNAPTIDKITAQTMLPHTRQPFQRIDPRQSSVQ